MNDSVKAPAPDFRLYVIFDTNDGWSGSRFGHVTVMPLVLAQGKYASSREWELHDPDSYELDGVPEALRALKGLRIEAQINCESGGWYGWDISYDLHRVKLREAEKILPVLRRIDKRLTAMSDQRGYATDLITFITRFAEALFPRNLARNPYLRQLHADDHDIEGTGYRSLDANGLRYWLDSQVREWRARYGVTVEAGS